MMMFDKMCLLPAYQQYGGYYLLTRRHGDFYAIGSKKQQKKINKNGN